MSRAQLAALVFGTSHLLAGTLAAQLPDGPAPGNAVSERFAELDRAVYDQMEACWREVDEFGETDRARMWQAYFELHAVHVYGDALLAFAREHADSEEALNVLCFILARFEGQVPDDEVHAAAIQEVIDHHRNNPHLSWLCDRATYFFNEPLFRNLLDQSDKPTVRAAAALALANIYDSYAFRKHYHELLERRYRDDEVTLAELRTIYRKVANQTREALLDNARRFAQVAIDEDADCRASTAEHDYGHMSYRFEATAHPQTYAQRAEALLFSLNHLREGCRPPEISGVDAYGNELELNDYLGKNVILLTFSFEGCGPCEAMYPMLRRLVAEYEGRPLTVLSVMADADPQSTRKAIEGGKVTWRCWWDGQQGPIARRWNVQSWPDVYLIDSMGRIRYRKFRDESVLPELVEELVSKAES